MPTKFYYTRTEVVLSALFIESNSPTVRFNTVSEFELRLKQTFYKFLQVYMLNNLDRGDLNYDHKCVAVVQATPEMIWFITNWNSDFH